MPTTRIFKSGNSLAVRLPKEIAFDEGTEVEIKREGAAITVTPVRIDMATFVARLSELSEPNMVWERPEFEAPERDWSGARIKT